MPLLWGPFRAAFPTDGIEQHFFNNLQGLPLPGKSPNHALYLFSPFALFPSLYLTHDP